MALGLFFTLHKRAAYMLISAQCVFGFEKSKRKSYPELAEGSSFVQDPLQASATPSSWVVSIKEHPPQGEHTTWATCPVTGPTKNTWRSHIALNRARPGQGIWDRKQTVPSRPSLGSISAHSLILPGRHSGFPRATPGPSFHSPLTDPKQFYPFHP